MALKKFDIEDIRKMAIKDFEKKYLKPTRLAILYLLRKR